MKVKTAADQAAALKAAADKVVAEMNPTPEMLKAIEAVAVVAKLTAEKARPAPAAAAK